MAEATCRRELDLEIPADEVVKLRLWIVHTNSFDA